MAVQSASIEVALRRRIEELEQERDALRIAITNIQEILGVFSVENPANNVTRESLRYRTIETMRKVLREAGRPMHREDIKKAVERRGIPVPHIQAIANHLSKAGGFVNEGRGYWTLHERWR